MKRKVFTSCFHALSICRLIFLTVRLAHLPTESFGVCHNELDSMQMAEIPKTLLIVQWGVSEDHHLKKKELSTMKSVFGFLLDHLFDLHCRVSL